MDVRGRRQLARSAGLALAGAVLLLVAAVLPWSAEPGGPSYTGLEHGDGYVTLGVAVVIVAVVLWRDWSPGARVATALAAVVPTYLFAKWFRAIRAETVTEPAVGLYLTLLAALLLLTAAAYSVEDETANGAAGAHGRESTAPAERDDDGAV